MNRSKKTAPTADLEKIVGDLASALHRLVVAVAAVPAPVAAAPVAPVRRGPGRPRRVVAAAPAAAPAPAPVAAAPKGRPAKAKKVKKAGGPVAPGVKAARQLQGQYMAAVRSLSVADKAKVRKMRNTQGIESSVKLALKLSGKK